jgi:Zn-finger nucleic acid-binding protein
MSELMRCPNCSAEMKEMNRYNADIDYCPSCRGVWLDRGEIDKIANMQRQYDDEQYQEYRESKRNYQEYDDDDDDYYKRRGRKGF